MEKQLQLVWFLAETNVHQLNLYVFSLIQGEMFRMHGYIFPPRVYLITDGKATPAGLVSGRDKCTPAEFEAVSFTLSFLLAKTFLKL
jgi:hypothetical protein